MLKHSKLLCPNIELAPTATGSFKKLKNLVLIRNSDFFFCPGLIDLFRNFRRCHDGPAKSQIPQVPVFKWKFETLRAFMKHEDQTY